MSFSIDKPKLQEVLTPSLRVNAPTEYAMVRGPSDRTWMNYGAQSYSTSSATFNFNPPSPKVVALRNMLIEMTVRLTFTGADQGSALLQIGTNDAPRAYPLNQCLSSVTATLDDQTLTVSNQSDIVDGILRYNLNAQLKQRMQSLTPCFQDQFQIYSDSYTSGSGNVRSPLNSYGNSSEGTVDGRGGFAGISVVSNTNTAAVVDITVTEPIALLAPFIFSDSSNEKGFINVQQYTFLFNFTDLTRWWSHSSLGNTISTIVATVPSQPKMLVSYCTVPELLDVQLPISYPFYKVERFTNSEVTLTTGSSSNQTLNNLQLNSIPHSMYIFARQRPSDRTYLTSDAYASIESVSIIWNNKSGILSGASKQQLYSICAENGLAMGYNQWAKFSGSVLKLEFGKDIPLGQLDAPGKLGTFQLQVQVTFKNQSSATVIYTPYIVVVSEGIFRIGKSQKNTEVGILSSEDVLAASEKGPDYNMDYVTVEDDRGGDLISGIKKLIPIYKKFQPIVQKVVEEGMDLLGDKFDNFDLKGGKKLSRLDLRNRSRK